MKKVCILSALILWTLVPLGIAGYASPAANPGCNYILIFQITEYDSKLGDAVDYFFKKMLRPEDQLSILTPARPYNFTSKTRENYTVDQLIAQTKKVLKRDTTVGAANYEQILQAMEAVVREISSGMDSSYSMSGGSGGTDMKAHMIQYRQLLENMRTVRKLNEDLFLKLAQSFKTLPGKNCLFIFYQEELRVIPSRQAMDNLRDNINYKADATELFEEESNEEFMDVEKVGQALKDASVTLNFLYINKQAKRKQGMQFKEFSGDVYNVLSKLAKATGGYLEATSKAAAALKKAHTAMEK